MRLYVELSPEEEAKYLQAREQYRGFVDERGISMGGPHGWQRFIQETCRSKEGRAAFQAYREQRRLSLAAPAKLGVLQKLLDRHRHDRMLIFTNDNATVYQIARRFLVPAITHQTKAKERRHILECFQSGEYPVVVTSRVLNEGVDVPAANVGVVLSGTRHGARARAAAGPAAAETRRKASAVVRSGDARHGGGVHQRTAAAASCVSIGRGTIRTRRIHPGASGKEIRIMAGSHDLNGNSTGEGSAAENARLAGRNCPLARGTTRAEAIGVRC